MRILVSGSREFNDVEYIEKCIANENPILIIHGNCPRGADRIADNYARKKGLPCIKMDANWDYYNKAAGPIRNRWMLDFCNPDLVIAFPIKESKGTRDMITAANKKGVPTLVFEQ
jgi:hypothetical protein